MKNIAVIPLRKGSKGILGKNKNKMVGRPLFSWVLTEAIFSNLDEVYVFTDDIEIINFIEKEYHWTSKVKALLRNEENANDTATTESVLLEFSDKINYEYTILCLIQATSPLILADDINKGLEKITKESFDSHVANTQVNVNEYIAKKLS